MRSQPTLDDQVPGDLVRAWVRLLAIGIASWERSADDLPGMEPAP